MLKRKVIKYRIISFSMVKRSEKYLSSFIILSIMMLTLVSSAPPFIQPTTSNPGYDIKIPQVGLLKTNEDHKFNFHVYNSSNGVPIDNSSTDCFFHLYNNGGRHLIEQEVTRDEESNVINEWDINVLAGNFTEEGQYSYIIQCNSTDLGGSVSVGFEVSNKNLNLNTSESIVYFILTLSVLAFFLVCLYFSLIIPYSNKINDKGAIIQVTKAKYFKLFLITITYLLFVWFLNLLIGLSDNFVNLTMYYGFIGFLFTMLNLLALPIIIFITILAAAEILRDINYKKQIKSLGSAFSK